MNWKRIAFVGGCAAALLGGAFFIGWAVVDALTRLSELQLGVLSAVGVGLGGGGVVAGLKGD